MPIDSGVFRILLVFGWAGSAVVGLALLQVLLAAMRRNELGPASLGFSVAVIAMLTHLPSGDVLTGPQGYLFWTAASLTAGKWVASSEKSGPRAVSAYDTVAIY
jgi:hypothetical protein